MQEVEAVCDRVIIIDQGRIIADSPTPELSGLSTRRQLISVEFNLPVSESLLMEIKNVDTVRVGSGNRWFLEAKTEEDIRPAIFQFAVEQNLTIVSLLKEEQKLEEVFQQLTQKS
ncbi:MAG: gliding motility-associated ABC transporter ATP-binding subunit GldA, partial [Bacteroidetes bacterium]|nr:gliding motility-associated ABC transporter ATP-binding subunit GldA [Bacteroidota bacterium]